MSRQSNVKEIILNAQKEGNVVFHYGGGELHEVPLEDFVQQPADGMLYDLNRLESVSMAFMDDDPKFINDYACAQVIRCLKEKLDKYKKRTFEMRLENLKKAEKISEKLEFLISLLNDRTPENWTLLDRRSGRTFRFEDNFFNKIKPAAKEAIDELIKEVKTL